MEAARRDGINVASKATPPNNAAVLKRTIWPKAVRPAEQIPHPSVQRNGDQSPEQKTKPYQRSGGFQEHGKYLIALRAQCQPYTKLAVPAAYCIGHHAIYANTGQQQR
jgi:hypothetical protein